VRKDYAHKPKVDVTTPGVPRSKVVLIVVVLILIAVLIVILLSVNSDHIFDRASVDQVDLVIPAEKTEVVKPIPIEQPTSPEFTYIKILQQADVTPAYVKEYKSTAKDPNKKTASLLQVASFKSEYDAKELQKLLTSKQLPNVEVNKSTAQSGSVWFKVMVGPFQNRSMLNKAQDILVQMNYSPLALKKNKLP